MASTIEQFIRFGTDTAGIERLLRLIQSILQVTTFYRPLLELTLSAIHTFHAGVVADRAALLLILTGLKSQAALTRRFFRVFRFVESFHSAHKLWTSLTPPAGTSRGEGDLDRFGRLGVHLAVLGRTFNGMYFLLEASVLLDVLGIEGLRPWGPRAEFITIESQRFWFFALVCGALGSSLRLLELWLYGVPASEGKGAVAEGRKSDEKVGGGDAGEEGKKREEKVNEARRRDTAARLYAVWRRLVSDVLDLSIPGSIVGYIGADAGLVGLAMLVTSVFTGMEVWEKCGQEINR